MGWRSAVGIVQYLHRRLCLNADPAGAGLNPKLELRRNVIAPGDCTGRHRQWWQVYCDNFDAGAAASTQELELKRQEL